MTIFRGLIYVKHGRVGSRSEGPDYHLQTADGDYLLHWEDRFPWNPDYHLEHFCRRMVEVRGGLTGQVLQVETLHEILSPHIPRTRMERRGIPETDGSARIPEAAEDRRLTRTSHPG